MSMRRPSNASSSVSAPPSPMSGVAASTSTIGSRRRAAAMASPSCVCAFSRIRKASSSAWKVLRSTILGAPSPSLMMSFIVLLCEPWSGFPLSRALSGGFFGVGYDVNPLRVSRGLGVVVVVPVPPLVRLGLGIALWRVLPSFLAAERCDIEVDPDAAHGLVGSVVDEVAAKHLLAVADEYIVAMPLVHAEVGVEAVRDGVPRHLPAHSRLHALNVLLRRARGVRERGVAGVQMGQVTDLIGAQGAAAASMVGPAEHAGLKEGAIEDQLSAALEQIEQAYLALGPIEFVLLLDGHPRHSPARASRERVKAFSFTRSCWRAASQASGDTIGGVFAGSCPFPCSLSLSLLVAILFSPLPSNLRKTKQAEIVRRNLRSCLSVAATPPWQRLPRLAAGKLRSDVRGPWLRRCANSPRSTGTRDRGRYLPRL